MKFSVNKKIIAGALAKVQGITSRKTNFAITECVMLKVSMNELTIMATDHETGFKGKYEIKVQEDGKIALNSRKLFEIVKEFPSDEIKMKKIDENRVEIYDNQVQYHLLGMDADEFPDLPKLEIENYIDIESTKLKRMIERAITIGGSGDEKRAHINGVYLQYFKEKQPPILRLVSTDGTRLALTDEKVKEKIDCFSNSGVLIPKKSINDVAKSLDASGKVSIGIEESYFLMLNKNEKLIVRLLEGKFPAYEEIIDRHDKGFNIEIEKIPFMDMLVRMSIMCNENYRAAIFDFKEDKLTIHSTNPEIGESKEDIEIKNGGNEIDLAFNPRYLIDALNAIEEDFIVLNFIDEEKPCIVSGRENRNYLNVIMPMRI